MMGPWALLRSSCPDPVASHGWPLCSTGRMSTWKRRSRMALITYEGRMCAPEGGSTILGKTVFTVTNMRSCIHGGDF